MWNLIVCVGVILLLPEGGVVEYMCEPKCKRRTRRSTPALPSASFSVLISEVSMALFAAVVLATEDPRLYAFV